MNKIGPETETNMFDGVAARTVEVELLEETFSAIVELCQEENWKLDEGLRIVMANGLAYLRGERNLAHLAAGDMDLASELEKRIDELADYQRMYAVMKFKAFSLLQVARTLEFNVAGLRGEREMARQTMLMLRQQVAALKSENSGLRERLAALEPLPAPDAVQLLPGRPGSSRDRTRPGVTRGGVFAPLWRWIRRVGR